MNNPHTNREQSSVWKRFREITRIPRASKKEEKIRQYLLRFASEHNLQADTDETGNVLIRAEATEGQEAADPVILQAHIDMVCEKDRTSPHNFDTDPIEWEIGEDGWAQAKGTTLGADDGIGVAMILAALEDADVKRPAVEALFTVDEEAGLGGAGGIRPDWIRAKRMINLDSEEEGQFCIGCAGGADTLASLNCSAEKPADGLFAFSLTVDGLQGGHSGEDIHRNRANAIKILSGLLHRMAAETDLRLARIDGGNLCNAIPRHAAALAVVPMNFKEQVRILTNIYLTEKEKDYAETDPGLKIGLTSADVPESVFPKGLTETVIRILEDCPHGPVAFNKDIPTLVDTSTNLASVKTLPDEVVIETLQRSSFEEEKRKIVERVASVFRSANAKVTVSGEYPGWTPNFHSPIMEQTRQTYLRLFGKEPVIKVIHAGLECGVFLKKYPDWDMVSFGPDMTGVHSPSERLNADSTDRTYELLKALLSDLCTS
ncbi:MAG: aminoacyl-histidine dipeptidase [Paludibacteraceae bacterium]|nr:aminoacyl-histidine dipeptidase [Paludibacteraceae bacterium]